MEIEDVAYHNQVKVIEAFSSERVAAMHFSGSTGYGYGDEGRSTLGRVFARAFGAEEGIATPHLLSGTHTLTVALFGVLRPGDEVLCVTGRPYDTLRGVISGKGGGTLEDYGVKFTEIPLLNGWFDLDKIKVKINRNVKMVYVQRSRGYELRDAFSVEEIGELIKFVRELGFLGCVFVDNCYGEFVEKIEPPDVGASVTVGSLIKNPGGGLAPTGGYIVGDKEYINLIGKRLTAPSIGLEVGSFEQGYRTFYEGLFLSPHVVSQAMKTSLLIGLSMSKLGYENFPSIDKMPYDITRAIKFNDEKKMLSFVREIQHASPVDGFADCEPWDMPGYDDPIIMAAGTFVSGASVELSADGPVKPPYIAYFQGGLTYEHGRYALERILAKIA